MRLGTRGREFTVPPERERLIEAMARSCATRGYNETTIEDVLAEARLSREDFDRSFADKEACAVAAVDSILSEGVATIGAAYSADTSERESALRTLKALLELFAARPALADLAFIHSRQMMPAEAHSRYVSGFAVWNAMLDRLRSEQIGEAKPPLSAARAAIGGGEALVRREIAAGHAGRLPRLLPDLVYSATVPFLGQEEALRLVREAHALLAGSERA
jgi:AcrR family transcriptional regulator